jgi:hypothetical protein
VQCCMEYVFHFTATKQDESASKPKADSNPKTTNFHHTPADALFGGFFFEQYRCGL